METITYNENEIGVVVLSNADFKEASSVQGIEILSEKEIDLKLMPSFSVKYGCTEYTYQSPAKGLVYVYEIIENRREEGFGAYIFSSLTEIDNPLELFNQYIEKIQNEVLGYTEKQEI